LPFFLPFPSLENRGAAQGRRRWPSTAPWASGVAGRRGKGAGRLVGSIPGRSSGGGGPRWPGHDGRWVAAALGRRPGGAAAVKERGKSTRGPCGVDSPAHLGQWWLVDGPPRRRAAVDREARGGGATELGESCAVVEVVCGGDGRREGPLIDRGRRWRGRGDGGGRQASRAPLMAFRAVSALRCSSVEASSGVWWRVAGMAGKQCARAVGGNGGHYAQLCSRRSR